MKYCTPEEAGISSDQVRKFFEVLEACKLSTHSVIMARGDAIFTEGYYQPFHKDFKHRMYSVSKSFVSIAVGFCEQEGLLSLDDPMVRYFADYVMDKKEDEIPNATIREMLHMQTAIEKGVSWFRTGTDDRTEVYFRTAPQKYPDTLFEYDSSASYMLGVIVEQVTGKPFLKYLQEKVLDDIGFSKDAYCIQAPGGHSFGDSGVMCTARDLLLFARFVMNKGTWNGKRYLNERYINEALTMTSPTEDFGFGDYEAYGYGYQFWGAPNGGFAMLGMGHQLAICDPAHDFVFVINSDNQGNACRCTNLYWALYTMIVPALGDPLPADPEAHATLLQALAEKKLYALSGAVNSDFAAEIDGREFVCGENPMGIKRFSLSFEGDRGVFRYENAQGEKELAFGMGYNVFEKFPEENYPDLIATVPEKGHRYDCAASAVWQQPRILQVRVQIIDKYFGNLAIIFAFRDGKHVSVRMRKVAEYFLMEYNGLMKAERKES